MFHGVLDRPKKDQAAICCTNMKGNAVTMMVIGSIDTLDYAIC